MIMSKPKVTSFKVSSDIFSKVDAQVIDEGYGSRGRSKWLSSSIIEFLSMDNEFCMDCIEIADSFEDKTQIISFRLSDEIEELLDSWVIKVREKHPSMEGVKSTILRAAVMQRLLGGANMKNATG